MGDRVKRIGLVAAGMLMAVTCVAQMAPSHGEMGDPHGGMQNSQGVMPSSRTDFGLACGIRDTSRQSAEGFRRSPEGQWSKMEGSAIPTISDSAAARLWRESNWMVDIHDGSGRGRPTIHTGQLCYNPQGRITLMIDRFMEMASCGCMRYTALSFGADGRITRREQRFVKVGTGEEMATPEAANEFPKIWEFRTLEQLPFYSLVKK
jgi:hypothetical protein